MNSKQRGVFWKAFLRSFLVYLIPIASSFVMPNSVWGVTLVRALLEARHDPEATRLASLVACAFVVQTSGFLCAYSYLRLRQSRVAGILLLSVPGLLIALNWLYLVGIPRYQFVQEDAAAEIPAWPVACVVSGFVFEDPQFAGTLGPDSPRVWISSRGAHPTPNVPEILDAQSCEVIELAIPWNFGGPGPILSSISSNQFALYVRYGSRGLFIEEHSERHVREGLMIGYVSAPQAAPRRIELPVELSRARPILSTNGRWIGWVQSQDGHTASRHEVRLINHETRETLSLALPNGRPGVYQLRDLNTEAGELTVTRNYTADFVVLDLDGDVLWGPMEIPETQAVRRIGPGWVRWDTRDDLPAKSVTWSLPDGGGNRIIPGGRVVYSLDVHPSEELVAISYGRRYPEDFPFLIDWEHKAVADEIPTVIAVFRASDGVEVFRKHLDQYLQPAQRFIGRDYFGYENERHAKSITVHRLTDTQISPAAN